METSTVQWEAKQHQVLNPCHVTRKKTKKVKGERERKDGVTPPSRMSLLSPGPVPPPVCVEESKVKQSKVAKLGTETGFRVLKGFGPVLCTTGSLLPCSFIYVKKGSIA